MIIKTIFLPFDIRITKVKKTQKESYVDSNPRAFIKTSYNKVFCIGRNKTGTTSIETTFKKLGFIVGDQRRAGLLLNNYIANDFAPIIEYCKRAQVFQDAPFSYPETYIHLDKAYPGSKFILTIRNDAEQWFNSVTRFHSKLFGNGNIPSAEQLKNAMYVYKGWIWQSIQVLYKTPENDPYNKQMLMDHYNKHNEDVMEYFKDRHYDLIVINLAEKGSYSKLMSFLNIESSDIDFPWENKTDSI